MFLSSCTPVWAFPGVDALGPCLDSPQWDPLLTETQASHTLLTPLPVVLLMPESEEKEEAEEEEQEE